MLRGRGSGRDGEGGGVGMVKGVVKGTFGVTKPF